MGFHLYARMHIQTSFGRRKSAFSESLLKICYWISSIHLTLMKLCNIWNSHYSHLKIFVFWDVTSITLYIVSIWEETVAIILA
jgi:hypothetical protein